MGHVLLHQRQHPRIRHDHRIHARGGNAIQIFFQGVKLLPVGNGVDRHVHFFISFVGVTHRFVYFVEGEVVRRRAHTEGSTRQIHRICPVAQSGFHFFHISRRGKQFGHVSSQSSMASIFIFIVLHFFQNVNRFGEFFIKMPTKNPPCLARGGRMVGLFGGDDKTKFIASPSV